MKEQDLIAKIAEKRSAMEALINTMEEENRSALNEEEQTKYDALVKEANDIKKQVENLRSLDGLKGLGDVSTKIGEGVTKIDANKLGDKPERFNARYSVAKAMRALVDPAYKLEGIEKEGHQEAVREFSSLGKDVKGIAIPSMLMSTHMTASEAQERIEVEESEYNKRFLQTELEKGGFQTRDLTVGTDTAGGHFVQTDVQRRINFLHPDLVLERAGARMLMGLSGDVKYPRQDSAPSIAWEGETDATAELNPSLDQFTLTPKRAAGLTDVSRQLIIQGPSSGNLGEQWAREELTMAVAQGVDKVGLNGGGSNEPTGIIQTGSIGDVAHGTNGGAPTWATVVEFVTDLAASNAYMGNLGWVITPEVIGQMMTIERATNTAVFLLQEPGTSLMGHPVYWSNNLPKTLTKGTGTGLHAAIFGNWRDLIVAQFGGLDLIVDEASQAPSGLVRLVVNTFWDIGLRHTESFTAAVDIDPTA